MFSEKAKLTALAIVHIFETSKPFGDYSAVAVLNDGAGVSYGINQFTHRSGSLLSVVNTYLGEGGHVGANVMQSVLPTLRQKTGAAIQALANNRVFKDALRFAGQTDEMRLAQNQIAENFYLLPAIDACEGSGFELPLSLAVIYDSINHGSWERIRDRVQPDPDEKRWITSYVQKRDAWLESVPRLAVTDYRTDFFLAQISRGNWQLDLPLNVHGHRLTDAEILISEPREFTEVKVPSLVRDTPEAPTPNRSAAELPVDNHPVSTPANEAATFAAENPPNPAQPPINGGAAAGVFKAEKFTAYIPQIDRARAWIVRATAGTFLAGVAAKFAGLPEWMQIGLFGLLCVIVVGAIIVFVKYHDRVFQFITDMNQLRAASDTHNPEISGAPPS